MKQILTSKTLRKLLILSCLIVGLVFVASSNNVQHAAVRCCIDCSDDQTVAYADFNGLAQYCLNKCGGDGNGSCYSSCRSNVQSCWSTCDVECTFAEHCGFVGCPLGSGCDQNTGLCY